MRSHAVCFSLEEWHKNSQIKSVIMLDQINIRFFSELNDFLQPDQRNNNFNLEVKKNRSVKDLIESIGVPHTEIDLIIVNAESVDFSRLIKGSEQIEVYPNSNIVDITPLIHNQPEPSPEQGFVLDVHLGKLAAYLRMFGFDTLYRNDYDDPTLAEISANENRILLSCDRKLLMRKQVNYGYIIRSDKPRQQIIEVLTHFKLFNVRPEFKRCITCNGIIQSIKKQQIESQLLPLTRKHYDNFYQCNSCKKIYWEGSHFSSIQTFIKNIKEGKHDPA